MRTFLLKKIIILIALVLPLTLTPLLFSDMTNQTKNQQYSSLSLTFKQGCPYCHKVQEALEKLNISSIDIKYVNDDPKLRERIITLGGKAQFPCLIINDHEVLYESDAIIDWFKNHKKTG